MLCMAGAEKPEEENGMSEQPERRLVHGKSYFKVESKFFSLLLLGTCASGVGVLLALLLLVEAVEWLGTPQWSGFAALVALGGVVVWILRYGLHTLARASEVEKVEKVTPQNAHLLPVEETLVRASVLPPSQQPAELLRVAEISRETPPEELLRVAVRVPDLNE
jgi:hypothetical protein